MNRIDRFLNLMMDLGASDLHLAVGRSPLLRVNGELEPLRFRVIEDRDFVQFMKPTFPSETLWERFLTEGDCDYSYEVPGLARFRVNVYMQEHGFGAAFRSIPNRLLTIAELGLPAAASRLCGLTRGLVLVTGPTGSGKSTTLTALIDQMNRERAMHMITVEDPIEFVHESREAVITQREVGTHVRSFSEALRAAVREDPDLILVGEMRDLETISLALDAASSGVLVFATLHTNSAAKTIDRIVNVFPSEEHDSVRNMLAETLQGVLAQQLLPRVGGGRVPAVEILFGGPALSNLIREGKTHQIPSYIQSGRKAGMILMDYSLYELLEAQVITEASAYEMAIDKAEFRNWLSEPPWEE